jgi:hypothetical protein
MMIKSENTRLSLLAGALVGLAVVMPLQAQVTSTDIHPAVTNNTVLSLTTGTYSFGAATNLVVDVPQGRELGLFFNGVSSTASTSNVTVTVEFTPDGTNWLDSPTLDLVTTLNGTTPRRAETNWPASLTVNLRKARLRSITSPAIAPYYATNLLFLTH